MKDTLISFFEEIMEITDEAVKELLSGKYEDEERIIYKYSNQKQFIKIIQQNDAFQGV